MVNSPLISPYFLGGGIGGVPLGSTDISCLKWGSFLAISGLSLSVSVALGIV